MVSDLISPEDDLSLYVFPSAILLANGKKLALSPLYLGSLYAGLDQCMANVVLSVGDMM